MGAEHHVLAAVALVGPAGGVKAVAVDLDHHPVRRPVEVHLETMQRRVDEWTRTLVRPALSSSVRAGEVTGSPSRMRMSRASRHGSGVADQVDRRVLAQQGAATDAALSASVERFGVLVPVVYD